MASGLRGGSKCPNLDNPQGGVAYNIAVRDGIPDGYDQLSLLRQVYPDNNQNNWLVGSSVAIFNGALGGQTLDKWDPTSFGWYATHDCEYDHFTNDNPECNYYRVADDLLLNHFSEKQVQAIFIKSGESFPDCDLQHNFCPMSDPPDAHIAEQHLGNILRYLKCCTLDGQHHSTGNPRYPNLKQVFVTSRTYGGYANGDPTQGAGDTCLNPEPFAYELGFAVQRLITAQIRQTGGITSPSDADAGQVDYTVAPWVDWGPYLWAYGEAKRNFDQMNWCKGQGDLACPHDQRDVIDGDLLDPVNYWGDYTHPAGTGVKKVANLLVNFIQTSPWVTPWKVK